MSTSETTTKNYEHLTMEEASMCLDDFKQHAAATLCSPVFQNDKIIEYFTINKYNNGSTLTDHLHSPGLKKCIRNQALALDPDDGMSSTYNIEELLAKYDGDDLQQLKEFHALETLKRRKKLRDSAFKKTNIYKDLPLTIFKEYVLGLELGQLFPEIYKKHSEKNKSSSKLKNENYITIDTALHQSLFSAASNVIEELLIFPSKKLSIKGARQIYYKCKINILLNYALTLRTHTCLTTATRANWIVDGFRVFCGNPSKTGIEGYWKISLFPPSITAQLLNYYYELTDVSDTTISKRYENNIKTLNIQSFLKSKDGLEYFPTLQEFRGLSISMLGRVHQIDLGQPLPLLKLQGGWQNSDIACLYARFRTVGENYYYKKIGISENDEIIIKELLETESAPPREIIEEAIVLAAPAAPEPADLTPPPEEEVILKKRYYIDISTFEDIINKKRGRGQTNNILTELKESLTSEL